MKATKLTYEAVFNLGNYQTIRLGGEYTLEPNETAEEAYVKIDRELRAEAMKIVEDRKPKQAEQPKQERIKIEDSDGKRIGEIGTAMCERVRSGKMTAAEVIAKIDEYYEVSDKVRKLWVQSLELQESI